MKRKLFDRHLWREGMRQLSLIGIMTFIVMELTAILVPVGYFISWQQTLNDPSNSFGLSNLAGTVAQPLLVMLPYTAAPLMTLFLFRFLNKRSASDVYHQFPVRRECLYLSFFAAIATWLTVITVISATTGQLLFAVLLPTRYALDAAGLWIYAFNMLAGSLLVAAGTTVAMSVTGNAFNNIVSTTALLFVPRLVLLIFTEQLIESIWVLPTDTVVPLLSVFYNIPAGMILGLFTGDAGSCITDPYAGVYSLCVALVYMGLAAWLFCRRKSEAAERASLNRGVQALLRVTVGFVIALIPCVLFISGETSANTVFWIVTVYIIALVVMMIYELITTRRWKNLPRAFASFGIVLGLSALFVGGEVLGRELILAVEPTAEDITSVQFLDDSDFFDQRVSKLTFDEPEVKELVALGLSQAIAADRVESITDDPDEEKRTYYDSIREVKIRMGLFSVARRIRLSEKQDAALEAALKQNATFRQAYTQLPAWGTPGLTVSSGAVSSTALKATYEAFREEVAACDFEDWYGFLQGETSTTLVDGELTLRLCFTARGQEHMRHVSIPWEFTETCRQAIVNSDEARAEAIRLLEAGTAVKYFDFQPLPTAYKYCGTEQLSGFEVNEETREYLLALLKNGTKPTPETAVARLSFYDYDGYIRDPLFVTLDDTNYWAFVGLNGGEVHVRELNLEYANAIYCEILENGTYRRVEIGGIIDRIRLEEIMNAKVQWSFGAVSGIYGALRLYIEGIYLDGQYDTAELYLYPDLEGSGTLLLTADADSVCRYIELYPVPWKELVTILGSYDEAIASLLNTAG